MKKLLLPVIALGLSALGNMASAQIADGSQAPDFTATDLNGNTHTLSNYLNAGKTVIIDVSATWCGPCWNYHNSHALRDIYEAYGPNGSDEVMVFFVEGDGSTTLADLNGTGSSTQGNWVEGTPYPILDNAGIANAYQIAYFPTIFRICPDGLVYEIGQKTAQQIVADISSACGSSAITGVQNHAQVEGEEIALCSTSASPEASFVNYGTNAVTSATLTLKENGSAVATAPFSGNVAQFATGTAIFPSMTINQGSAYTVELTQVNGGAPHNTTTDAMSVVAANLSGLNITVKVFTDNYPGETTWELRNSATNALVASGGPYQGNGANAGGPDALTTKTHDVTLPAGTNCYKLKVMDAYGDGFGYGVNPAGQYGVEIVSGGNVILNLDMGNFGSSYERGAALRTDASAGVTELAIDGFAIFPNPATDNVTVAFTAENTDYSINIVDMQGRVVLAHEYTNLSGNQNINIGVDHLKAGNYMVVVSSNGQAARKNIAVH